jgi:hypothetical protein
MIKQVDIEQEVKSKFSEFYETQKKRIEKDGEKKKAEHEGYI